MKGVSGQEMMFVCLVRFGAGDDVVILFGLIVILWFGPFELVGQES